MLFLIISIKVAIYYKTQLQCYNSQFCSYTKHRGWSKFLNCMHTNTYILKYDCRNMAFNPCCRMMPYNHQNHDSSHWAHWNWTPAWEFLIELKFCNNYIVWLRAYHYYWIKSMQSKCGIFVVDTWCHRLGNHSCCHVGRDISCHMSNVAWISSTHFTMFNRRGVGFVT